MQTPAAWLALSKCNWYEIQILKLVHTLWPQVTPLQVSEGLLEGADL
jgi:hypothetical protein